MRLTRPARSRGRITLVPLIDVLLILLVFFMVTSRYENLGMIALVTEEGAATAPGAAPGAAGPGRTVLLRLAADGRIWLPGTTAGLDAPALEALLQDLAGDRVRILAAPEARTQALVDLGAAAARAGVADLRILRVAEAR